MTNTLSIEWLAERLQDRTTRGIALETSALIRSGAIPVGIQLPPVRELAQALGVSPATISSAWSELRRHKVISGRGRTGVWVSGDKIAPRPQRFENIGNFGDHVIDLSVATPDPALLPPLEEALSHGAKTGRLNSYQRIPITDALREAVREKWPYPAQAFLAANGGFEAIYVTLQALVMPGSVIAIEDPTQMRLLDILDNLGAHVVPVACDEEGPRLDCLAQALQRKPAAFLYQPRTHAVTGHKVSAARLDDMARLLKDSDTLIVEDDGISNLSAQPPASLGAHFPERTVHIMSYSKTFGPDLRLAVLSSSNDIVSQIQAYRSFGAGWTSRILQDAVAWLINDQKTADIVVHAKSVYAERRRALLAALTQRGVHLPDRDGLCLWIPVRSEQFAMVTLAARRIAVLPGRKCSIKPTHHVRVATSHLTVNVEEVADAIALIDPETMFGRISV
ncbi:PLP-dependent aminotransferase family protein [Microvirga terricola]|uniref:8-amino-7-oxononanoate synthase n=1 Tax=Microvirga terricola TaxID=2719797 RepID=A0ABX0VAD6_9HYPH|nr:aminotransferase class I/II-fold pyridoxal phosphate-dependent enzyme [Microvirga terricola]NIX76663.1 aminotransferase class I/II-fold pyridoxal phosphate-dependent enzyme [Microvirga terricola]